MTVSVYPGDSNTVQNEWPLVARPDGIINDFDGSAFGIVTSGSSPTVTIGPGQCSVAGFAVISDDDETLDLSTVGDAPTSGQKRVDLVVARYDWSAADVDLNTAGLIAIRPGNPVSSATSDAAAAPTPTRELGVLYEVPLYRVTRPAGGVVTSVVPVREWSYRAKLLDPQAVLGVEPLGTEVVRADARFLRRLNPNSGSPEWHQDSPDPLRGFGWGGSTYNWQDTSAGWSTPPGASRSYPLKAGHLYMLESELTVVADSNARVRVSLWFDSTPVREIELIAATQARIPVHISGYFRPANGGDVSVQTRTATSAGGPPFRILHDFSSPSSRLVDLGYRSS